jgi:carbon-monoxide dehydrogenase medium subunit
MLDRGRVGQDGRALRRSSSPATPTVKPPPFTYCRPSSIDEALDLLARHDDARVMAGGQSLMPMLNFRVVAPGHLVDLNRIPELAFIRDTGTSIAFGAMTRQRTIEFSPVIAQRLPLLAEAILQIGHRQTRNRGTIGGSLCHLDPSAEIPTVAMAMDAQLSVRSARGERVVAMADFPAGYMTPCLEPGEMLCEIRMQPWPAGHGYAFLEFARRKGDFAIVSVAAMLTLDAAGRISRAALALGGVGSAPLRMARAEAALVGAQPDAATLAAVAAGCADIEALSDPAVPAWYRQHLATVLVGRALTRAVARTRG